MPSFLIPIPSGLSLPSPTIYLDNNATTQPAPQVVQAVADAMRDRWANPSSVHRMGQDARHALELARDSVAALIGAKPKNLTFTSGGTESIDLAIRAFSPPAPSGGQHEALRVRGGRTRSPVWSRRASNTPPCANWSIISPSAA